MRTAEEHINNARDKHINTTYFVLSPAINNIIKYAINEARKEAIEECCRVALDYVSESEELLILDQKILSLINDLK